jgi:putative nucleotidyltransferase with HDIG domain
MLQTNRTDADFLASFLGQVAGYEVQQAADGPDLVRKAHPAPGLILIDTQMEGDFLRTVEVMRRHPALGKVPIAVVTADHRRLPDCHGKGVDGYILKPFTPQTLLAKIWKLLRTGPAARGGAGGKKVDLKVDKVENLPTLPTVYAEVERLCQNPDVDADDLSRVIETDPSITLKLLRLVNSAFFGFTRKISSTKDAVSLLGNQTVKNAVLSISIFNATQDQKGGTEFDRKRFWQHSAGVGSVTRFLARKLEIQREDCFTAGILHDIGKIILDALFPEFYAPVLKAVGARGIPIYQAEQDEMGMNHAGLGRELAVSWKIPEPLIEAIAHHHRPGGSSTDPELACLVHLADILTRNAGVGPGGEDLVPVIDEFALKKLGIATDRFVEWEEEMGKELEKDRAFLSAIG